MQSSFALEHQEAEPSVFGSLAINAKSSRIDVKSEPESVLLCNPERPQRRQPPLRRLS